LDSIRSQETARKYKNALYTFLKFIPNQLYIDSLEKTPTSRTHEKLTECFVELAKKDSEITSNVIAAYIKEERRYVKTGEMSSQTLPNHIKPIKVLLDANRIPVHWKSLNKLMPRRETVAKERQILQIN
jgi:hypothetical protein